MRRWATIPLLLFIALTLHGQNPDISVDTAGVSTMEVDPGETVSFALIVRNTTDREQRVYSELRMPEGFRELYYTERMAIDPVSENLSLVSLYVPQSAKAGLYTIEYVSWTSDRPGDRIPATVQVVVREKILTSIEPEEASAYVIAGQKITASFSIENQSNADVYVEFVASSSEGYPVEIVAETGEGGEETNLEEAAKDAEVVLIGVGRRRTVSVYVKTDPTISSLVRHRTRGTAHVLDASANRSTTVGPVTAQAETEIFPRARISGDRFRRLPLRLRLLQANSFAPAWQGSGGISLSAKGALDSAEKHLIDLLIAKSIDLPPERIIEEDDVYRLKYENDFLELSLGDFNYSLTPLLERNTYARGANLDVFLGRFEFGGYYRFVPYVEPPDQLAAGYVSFLPVADQYRTSVSSVSSFEETLMLSLMQFAQPIPELALEAEMAVEQSFAGGREYGFRLEGEGEYEWITYSGEFVRAGPGFNGSYQDLLLFGGNIGFEFLNGQLGVATGLHRQARNLDLDVTGASAPLKWSYVLTSDVTLPSGDTSFAAAWNLTSRKDMLPDPSFHTLSNTMKLSAEQSIGSLTLSGSASLGLEKYRLEDRLRVSHEYLLSSLYQSAGSRSYSVDLGYKGTVLADAITVHEIEWSTGIDVSGQIVALDFSFDNRFQFESDTLDYSTVGASLDLEFELGKKSDLLFSIFYNYAAAAGGNHSGGVSVEFSTSLGIPVGLKEDVGTLRGTVVDTETGEPLQDIIVRTGGGAAVTDAKGRFSFPALEPGVRLLDVDVSRADTFLQPFTDTPIEVVIEEKKTTNLVIEMGRRSVVQGTVLQYAFPPEDSSFDSETDSGTSGDEEMVEEYVRSGGIRGVLLELTNGVETYRRLTDRSGRFAFEDIIPGQWKLIVYDHNIPQYHFIEEKEFNLDLTVGERADIEIRVLPERRKMKVIDEGTLSL